VRQVVFALMNRLALKIAYGAQQVWARVFAPRRVARRDGLTASEMLSGVERSGVPPGERVGAVPRLAAKQDTDERTIPPELLKRIRQIEIRTRRLVSETLAGQYHSAFKGQGMDFDEVREYQPGDEVRTIDWNVTARMNHPFVKKFREERELTVILAVDLSASGLFGSGLQSKRDFMAELGAVLAFSAIRNQDKVGLLLFSEVVEKFVPPGKGRRHVLRVVRDILFHTPEFSGTSVNGALEFLSRVLPHRAVVVVLSDFLAETNPGRAQIAAHLRRRAVHSETLGRLSQTALTQLARRHDLIALQISDPREQELPDIGRLVLKDAETGDLVEVNASDARRRQAFVVRQERTQIELERLFRNSRVDHLRLTTPAPGSEDETHYRELAAFFETRQKRRRR
jgi:uncharacterized protein (DUF58 family)